MLNRMVQFIPQSPVVTIDLCSLWPIAWRVARQSAAHRIDPECKKVIERPLHERQPERALRQQVPIKCFNVSQVKNDAVPFWNGPVVNSFVEHNAKQIICLRARV